MTFSPASAESGFFRSRELSPKYDRAAIGISVSGGGYRATLFHTGAFLRLNELGILSRAARIASVSGGSLTAGILAMNWDRIDWRDGTAAHGDMVEHLVRPVIEATSKTIDTGVGIGGFLPGVSAGDLLARSYDRNIFSGLPLSGITDKTQFIFCAANLQTGGLVRFARNYVADWRALMATTRTIRLSEAVAASSGFPPVLSPVRIDLAGESVTVPEGARWSDPGLRRRLVLVDGGVYDNLGLEPIWKRCGILFTSYAGSNNPPMAKRFVTGQMLRVVNTFLDVSIDWRERNLINLFRNTLSDGRPERAGAYWTIATDPAAYGAAWNGYKADAALLRAAAGMPTRLRKFPRSEQNAAILAGYSHADAAIRRYYLESAAAPAAAPVLP